MLRVKIAILHFRCRRGWRRRLENVGDDDVDEVEIPGDDWLTRKIPRDELSSLR